ncbi:very short patch repair endonuclease, partial [Legionella pneumophila]
MEGNFLDMISKKQRSHIMSSIKGKNTKPEIIVRSFLHRQGLRFRLHSKNLPGQPDLVFRKYNAVVFVNGCFWHG